MLLVVLVCLVAAGTQVQMEAPKRAPELKKLVSIPAQPHQVTVPLILEGNTPIVELEFPAASGGVRKARFVVDTGGGGFLLGNKLMADIGAKPSGPVSEEEGDPIVPLSPVTVHLGGMDLDLSGVWIGGLPANQWVVGARNDAEGLLPARVLRHYDVIFDYPGRRFTLAKAGTFKPEGVKIAAPISPDLAFPRVEVQIGGSIYGFLLDTGASFTMISRTALDQWTKDNPMWPKAVGAIGFANMLGGAKENEALMLRISELRIGSLVVKQPAAVSRPEGTFEKRMSGMMTAPIIGSLGGNVLRDFRVSIDYQNGFAYFEPSATSSEADLTSIGLVLAGGPKGSLVITGISSNASADVTTSVRAGDKLLAVDDASLSGRPLATAAEALQGRPESTKRLTLERDGKKLTVTATVKVLL